MDPIVAVEEIPEDSSFLFTVQHCETDEREEAILLRSDAGVRCWRNYCRHFTHVRLDSGDGVVRRDGELVCTNHGAMFDADSRPARSAPARVPSSMLSTWPCGTTPST